MVSLKEGDPLLSISVYSNELLKLFIDKLLLYPCVKLILVNISESTGSLDKPLNIMAQLGLGNIPENGFDLILELFWFNKFTFLGSCPV